MPAFSSAFLIVSLTLGCVTANFYNDMNNLEIQEDTLPGTTVYKLIAEDGLNSQLRYGLINTTIFTVNEETGDVKLIRQLDYELNSSVQFATVVRGLNGSQEPVIHPVTVFVKDVNDNAPYFTSAQPIEVYLTESTSAGSTLASIAAVDPDQIGQSFLSIYCTSIALPESNLCHYFSLRGNYSVNSAVADLVLLVDGNQILAYEAPVYELYLTVTDGLHKSDILVRLIANSDKTRTSDSTFTIESTAANLFQFEPPSAFLNVTENWPVNYSLPTTTRFRVTSKSVEPISLTIRETDSALSGSFAVRPPIIQGTNEFFDIVPLRIEATDRERYTGDIRLQIDATSTAGSASMFLIIRLLDVNDNPPKFLQDSYTFVVMDDAEDGRFVGNAEATDGDTGQYGIEGLTYALLGPYAKYFRPFVQRPDVVEIRTAKCDHELWSDCKTLKQLPETFVVILRVADANGTGLFTDAPMIVKIERSEKHAPTISKAQYFSRLREAGAYFEPPIVIQANDEDGSVLKYSLDSTLGGVFGIDSRTGAVFVQNPQEVTVVKLGRRIILTAFVSDSSHAPAFANITIDIIEMNEESRRNLPPKFRMPSLQFLMPPGAGQGYLIGNVIAEDPESTPVRYHLSGGGEALFALDQDTGELSFIGPHFLVNQTYTLTILAADLGSPPAYAAVSLTVTGAALNSEEPKFKDIVYTAFVSENASVSTELIKLNAIDPDANDALAYSVDRVVAFDLNGRPSMVEENEFLTYFGFQNERLLLLKSLYDIDLSVAHIHVQVSDVNHPMESAADTLIVLNVIPVLKPLRRTFSFFDSKSVGEQQTRTINVEVPDSLKHGGFIYQFFTMEKPPAAQPPSVTYRIVNESKYFAIDETTGTVFVTDSLMDAPERSNLVIEATNQANHEKLNAELVIKIKKPVKRTFELHPNYFSVSLPEDTPTNSTVLRASSTADETAIVRYYLTGPDNNTFAIDEQGGVNLMEQLDREKVDAMAFMIEAELLSADDNSVLAHSVAPVTVHIMDINDNSPMFENNSYVAAAAEDALTDSFLFYVKATDEDFGENGTIRYSLENLPEELNGHISIHATEGIVTSVRSLLNLAGTYTFLVVASDVGGSNSSVPVTLTIDSISLCQPVWLKPDENSTILDAEENLPIGHVIGRVLAKTEGENCKLKYTFFDSLLGQSTSFTAEFEMDEISGEIRTKLPLDREKQSRYTLMVAVKNSQLSDARTMLEINVIDVDDNPPVFEPPSIISRYCVSEDLADCWSSAVPRTYNFTVFENEPSGTVLGVVRANDKDEGNNARIYYHLIGEAKSRFDIDSTTGRLSLVKPLDYEEMKTVEVFIVATNTSTIENDLAQQLITDLSSPSLSRALVTVLDLNDNAPMFERRVYLAAVSNETAADSLTTGVRAHDPDTGIGGIVYYRLRQVDYHYKDSNVSERYAFVINSTNGELFSTTKLAKYNQGYFRMTVESSNAFNYTSNLTDTTIVKMWVYSADQLIRIVAKEKPTTILDHADEIVKELGDTLGADVILQKIEYHRDGFGTISEDKVNLLVVFVDRSSQEVMDATRVLSVVDMKGLTLTASSQNMGVLQILPVYGTPEPTVARLSGAAIALLTFGCVMFVGLLGLVLMLCYFKYTAIKTMRAEVKVAPELPPKLPQPVLSSLKFVKENPLWNEIEKKPYEEQELSFPVANSDLARNKHDSLPPSQLRPALDFPSLAESMPAYARIQKQSQISPPSSTTSESGDDFYQTLRLK